DMTVSTPKHPARAVCAVFLAALAVPALAEHPLITDDAGTQGKGKAQLELVAEYARAEDAGVVEKTLVGPTMPVLSIGLRDDVDVVSGISYQRTTVEDAGFRVTQSGAADFALDVKWRFYERAGLGLALKPGLTLPTGDHEKGLGAGKSTQRLFAIATQEAGPWAFHANVGFTRNANRAGDREALWHASAAAARVAVKDLKATANVGVDTNPDPSSRRMPAYVLGGLVYAVSESLALDVGARRSFNVSGTAYAVLAGMTIRL
ncbi:MAG: transporter, partial [Elusimicrobia bacterium]|nr:transporter [Elusimicrobiota bacterium]